MLTIFSPQVPDSLPLLLQELGQMLFDSHRQQDEKMTLLFLNSLERIIEWVEEGPKIGDIFQVRTEAWKRDQVVRNLIPAMLDMFALPVRRLSFGEKTTPVIPEEVLGRVWDLVGSDPNITEWNVKAFYGNRDAAAWVLHSRGKEADETAKFRAGESFSRLLVHARWWHEAAEFLGIGGDESRELKPTSGKKGVERYRLLLFHFLARCRDQTLHVTRSYADGRLERRVQPAAYPLAALSAPHEYELARVWKRMGDSIGWTGAVWGVLGDSKVEKDRCPEWMTAPTEGTEHWGGHYKEKVRWRGVFAVTPN
jgi:hypothetical protein